MDENIGKIYGDIELIEYLGNWNNSRNYNCRCLKCGRIKRTQLKHLKNGLGVSHKTCGLGLKQKDKRFYQIWCDMRKRTTNPNSSEWYNYGGRGISSEEYKFFIDFFDDMYQSYAEHKIKYGEKDTTLDRINPNDDYCPNNCRWISLEENARYKSTTNYINVNGIVKSGREWSKHLGLGVNFINRYLRKNGMEDTIMFIRERI